jgi:hypothetical protein
MQEKISFAAGSNSGPSFPKCLEATGSGGTSVEIRFVNICSVKLTSNGLLHISRDPFKLSVRLLASSF